MMHTNRHRAAELPASPRSRRAGGHRSAALAGALAVLMLGTTAAVAAPTVKAGLQPLDPGAGEVVQAKAQFTFDNAGTNPRFTAATFSTMDYYVEANTGITGTLSDFIDIKPKTSAELGAMSPPPSNPFSVDVTVTMRNDEFHVVTDTIEVITYW